MKYWPKCEYDYIFFLELSAEAGLLFELIRKRQRGLHVPVESGAT